MIDFRYHLVSIVSVFLALAVGIVLGAGPLQGRIADALASEITQLRTDKQSLRADLVALQESQNAHEAFDDAVLSRVVSGLFSGRTVAVVELPGADADQVRQIGQAITAAGGTVSSTTRVLDSWVDSDPATQSALTDVVTKLAPTLRVPITSSSEASSLADRVLASALSATSASAATATADAARSAVAELVKSKFLEVDGQVGAPAQFVVTVSEPLAGVDSRTVAQAKAWVRLAGALDAASQGCVVAAAASSETGKTQTSVVRVLRDDSDGAKKASTVDNVRTTMGRASVVLALLGQESGTTGHYGTDEGATAAFAPLPNS